MSHPPSNQTPVDGGRELLLTTVAHQRRGCTLAGSPLYVQVLEAMAADVADGGVCWQILEGHAEAPIGDAILLRLLAGVHRVVLEGRAPELAAHYPSVGGTPGADVGAVFVRTVEEHEARLRAEMSRGVQTNEVGRSVAILTGLLALAGNRPDPLRVRLLEVGASAGLNLWPDRYRFEANDRGTGPIDSPVRFVSPWLGNVPDLSRRFEVVSRSGCDRAPIDPTTPEGRRLLRSYVWPDQVERRQRLDAAISVAATEAPVVETADAVKWVTDHLATEPATGVTTVLFHTIVLQYLAPDDRSHFVEAIQAAGRRATVDAPLAWLRMEPAGDQAEVWLTTWPDGATRRVARSGYHGPPVVLADASASSGSSGPSGSSAS